MSSCTGRNSPTEPEVSTMTAACGTILYFSVKKNSVRINDQHISLKSTSCKILALLIRHAGQIVSRKTILSAVWGYDFDPGTKIIDVQVCYLRKALNAIDVPCEIRTHRGRGVCLRFRGHSGQEPMLPR
ncbi:winged helix-turn-helix domain-containing protein [Pseudomonas monteilii]|uniref:winged helix-turn-helix domain-containing protein n=1 Tax=Pseudomonas monteilii TaxID=76759 RepID=UPI0038235990